MSQTKAQVLELFTPTAETLKAIYIKEENGKVQNMLKSKSRLSSKHGRLQTILYIYFYDVRVKKLDKIETSSKRLNVAHLASIRKRITKIYHHPSNTMQFSRYE